MINRVLYLDTNWPDDTPIAGERLATNGHYTGEVKGTPTQDALEYEGANVPHFVEYDTVRLGTMMGDAADPNYPEID